MHERILRQMREKVRTRQYVMTLHAEEEMDNDSLSIFDVERAILTGIIDERQENHVSGEWKYVITGESIDGRSVTVVGKLSVTGKLIIITVYRDEWKTMSNGGTENLVCDVCGKPGTRTKLITRSYGRGASLLVIENIPVVSCPHCGESYLTADTLHEIERIKLQRDFFAVERPVPVAEFA